MDNNDSVALSRYQYWVLLFALIAVIAPFWTVIVPAATDLPQHLSQLYLFQHTLAGERPDLMVTPWYYPNTLIYWVLYGAWLIFDPITTGKLAMSGMAAAWVVASWGLMKVYRRSFMGWLIGVPLVFNFLFSWGFLNFLIGWPVFCLFIIAARRPASFRRNVALMLAALLLYYAHALWFAMATIWLGVLMLELNNKERWSLGWPLLPVWLMALIWYPQLAVDRAQSYNTGVLWIKMPHERFDTEYVVNAMLGSIQGKIEGYICLILGLWLLASLLTNRKRLSEETDKPLFIAGLIMGWAFWIFPDMYMNTIFFGQRWLPFGVVLLLLAVPTPHLPHWLSVKMPARASHYAILAGVGLVLTLSVVTIKQLQEWQSEALDGFLSAIGMLHKSERVIGMNLYDGSAYVKGRPGLQLFSYAEAMHGSVPQFEFTQHYSGVVQFRGHPQLKSYPLYAPLRTTYEQVKDFDKILVNGDETMHVYVRKRWHLVQIGDAQSNWRVYRNAP